MSRSRPNRQPPTSAAAPGATPQEQVVRKWYAAWEAKDWGSLDTLAADDFTFSSAAGDDHISNSALIDRFELESVVGNGNEVFVKYVCRTKNGKTFRNVEHFTFKGDKVAALECYFGNQAGYPSAANKGKE